MPKIQIWDGSQHFWLFFRSYGNVDLLCFGVHMSLEAIEGATQPEYGQSDHLGHQSGTCNSLPSRCGAYLGTNGDISGNNVTDIS